MSASAATCWPQVAACCSLVAATFSAARCVATGATGAAGAAHTGATFAHSCAGLVTSASWPAHTQRAGVCGRRSRSHRPSCADSPTRRLRGAAADRPLGPSMSRAQLIFGRRTDVYISGASRNGAARRTCRKTAPNRCTSEHITRRLVSRPSGAIMRPLASGAGQHFAGRLRHAYIHWLGGERARAGQHSAPTRRRLAVDSPPNSMHNQNK